MLPWPGFHLIVARVDHQWPRMAPRPEGSREPLGQLDVNSPKGPVRPSATTRENTVALLTPAPFGLEVHLLTHLQPLTLYLLLYTRDIYLNIPMIAECGIAWLHQARLGTEEPAAKFGQVGRSDS